MKIRIEECSEELLAPVFEVLATLGYDSMMLYTEDTSAAISTASRSSSTHPCPI